MPQKKNPDAWELLRGKTGRITAALVSLLVTLKGLPSSYQRDLQEDKEPVFAAHDQAAAMVRIAAGAVAATRSERSPPARGRRRSGAAGHRSGALPGSPRPAFPPGARNRRADRARSRARGESWTALPLAKLKTFSPLFEADLHEALTVKAALESRDVPGGTAPARVRQALGRMPQAAGRMGGSRMKLAPANCAAARFSFRRGELRPAQAAQPRSRPDPGRRARRRPPAFSRRTSCRPRRWCSAASICARLRARIRAVIVNSRETPTAPPGRRGWQPPGRRPGRSRRASVALPNRCWSARPASSACRLRVERIMRRRAWL